MITIENIANGCLLSLDDEFGKVAHTFDDSNIEGLAEMLWTISESIKACSRYDKYRIKISIVHGDKYECKDKKCKICSI